MITAKAPDSYDRIAHLYDADMGRNMRFDDVGFYMRLARAARGRTLELGCGNGRILLELHAAGIEAYGADASMPMLAALAAKARARSLVPKVARMDVRSLGFAVAFDLVLCPYSLITYMRDRTDAAALLAESRRVLLPGGCIVVDAFVPRAAPRDGVLRRDYTRALERGTLTRSKRIDAIADGVNRIERRYEVTSEAGAAAVIIETVDEIREYAPDAMLAALADAGFTDADVWWDYTDRGPRPEAQFYTVVARAPQAARTGRGTG